MKKIILTLVLGVAAAASAQTTGDAPWRSGKPIPPAPSSPPAQTSTKSACADKESGQPWLQCVLQEHATEIAAAKAAAQQVAQTPADPQCANSTSGKYWVPTSYGGYCLWVRPNSGTAHRDGEHWTSPDPKMPASAMQVDLLAVQQQHDLQARQAEYQRQLLQQQAEYQQQLLQQQADIARRQMVLQYLMNRPSYTPYMLPMPQVPVYQMPMPQNNQIHCTTQTLGGGMSSTNCY